MKLDDIDVGSYVYRVWIDENGKHGEVYVVLKKLGSLKFLVRDRKNNELELSYYVDNLILSKSEAIEKFNHLSLNNLKTEKNFNIKLEQNLKNEDLFNKLEVGQLYYTVKRTIDEPIVEKFLLKRKIRDYYAVIVLDDNNQEKKIYSSSLSTLLKKDEAHALLNQYKKLGPIKIAKLSTEIETKCHNCGNYITRLNSNKCNVCKWNNCSHCGSCGCNYK